MFEVILYWQYFPNSLSFPDGNFELLRIKVYSTVKRSRRRLFPKLIQFIRWWKQSPDTTCRGGGGNLGEKKKRNNRQSTHHLSNEQIARWALVSFSNRSHQSVDWNQIVLEKKSLSIKLFLTLWAMSSWKVVLVLVHRYAEIGLVSLQLRLLFAIFLLAYKQTFYWDAFHTLCHMLLLIITIAASLKLMNYSLIWVTVT